MHRRLASIFLVILLLHRAWTHAAENPRIDEHRAWQFLTTQVSFGPRIPESAALQKTRALILETLSQSGFSTHTQTFRGYAPALGRIVSGTNIYGLIPPHGTAKVVFSAHYDTRPVADMERSAQRRSQPIPGANDGASGVAVLLSVAEALKNTTPPKCLALVFFDLEDSGVPSDPNGYCLGSQHMAANLPSELQAFEIGINIDMVGEKNLRLPMEVNSLRAVPEATRLFWQIGSQVAPHTFVNETGMPIYDDHMPFLQIGRRYINVIDFDYPQWHTLDDSVEQCSSKSLKAVGDTLLQFLFQ